MQSTPRALASRGASLAVVVAFVVLLSGCSAITSITGGGSSAPGASGAGGSAKPGGSHAWPAAFQDSFCAGIASLGSATADLKKLADAATASDFAGVSKFAKAALTKVKAADAALKLAPAWGPPTDAIAAYRSALSTYITGLTDIEKGARTKNATLLLRSLPLLSAGVSQLAPAQTAYAALRLGTGFAC
jgi:hypothetical protein